MKDSDIEEFKAIVWSAIGTYAISQKLFFIAFSCLFWFVLKMSFAIIKASKGE